MLIKTIGNYVCFKVSAESTKNSTLALLLYISVLSEENLIILIIFCTVILSVNTLCVNVQHKNYRRVMNNQGSSIYIICNKFNFKFKFSQLKKHIYLFLICNRLLFLLHLQSELV